ncbi:MAG TPA: putative toxin-antitoxin system toxin component, PIN family [Clostridia bacterium]|nr:putative toxin-antitoxin system toxin component, PIN family [Clostridia bacterium]
MRIMVDTNVLISVILFPNARMDEMMKIIIEKHRLVLSTLIIEELMEVVKRKFKDKEAAMDRFLSIFPYELVYTPKEVQKGLFDIRDEKDYPLLYVAIIEDVDILITGDKDFLDVKIEKPLILTPAQFLEKFS